MTRRAMLAALALALPLALAPLAASPAPSLYAQACAGTIVPPALLRAVARAESSERDNAVGDDGVSIGRYQLNERYHAERARLYGEYNPRDPLAAGYVAARILESNYRRLGSWPLAVAAYRQGVRGVRERGATWWYVERVRREGGPL